jgi:hypothetical protein
VSGVNIYQSETREKLADQRQDLVWNIFASSPTDEQRGLFKPNFAWIFKGKISQIIQ